MIINIPLTTWDWIKPSKHLNGTSMPSETLRYYIKQSNTSALKHCSSIISGQLPVGHGRQCGAATSMTAMNLRTISQHVVLRNLITSIPTMTVKIWTNYLKIGRAHV